MISQGIPHIKMPDFSDMNFSALNEPMVDIALYSHSLIAVDMKYHQARRPGAIKKAYVRLSVAKKLTEAQKLLPEGYRLKIFDAWRPYEVQKDIYYEYYNKLKALPENINKSENELHSLTKTFVSFPNREKLFSFVHSSGGAVDLTIVNEKDEELDMGCAFDDFSTLAYTDALEKTDRSLQKNNRRLLYNTMCKAGFTNYPCEWWHFDYRDIFWGSLTGEKEIYPSAFTIE